MSGPPRATAAPGVHAAKRTAVPRAAAGAGAGLGPLTFTRLKWTSFAHSLVYLALLVSAFAAGKPEPLTEA
ncbi:MAG TPA: hypothetical protein VNZ05_04900, partial [Solirubrobacteraceae bacterium]|nr:hypothetical protein [Solirubrobacteraceae bacterium]